MIRDFELEAERRLFEAWVVRERGFDAESVRASRTPEGFSTELLHALWDGWWARASRDG